METLESVSMLKEPSPLGHRIIVYFNSKRQCIHGGIRNVLEHVPLNFLRSSKCNVGSTHKRCSHHGVKISPFFAIFILGRCHYSYQLNRHFFTILKVFFFNTRRTHHVVSQWGVFQCIVTGRVTYFNKCYRIWCILVLNNCYP